MLITVIVPTLNEAVALPGALEHVGALEGSWEVIVADGGSADGTWPRPVALVGSTRAGRSSRPRAPDECGRRVGPGTRADLSHADTRLAADAHARVAGALAAGAQGGNFTLRFEDRRWRLQSLLDVGVRATAPHRLLLRRLRDLAAHRSVRRARRLPRPAGDRGPRPRPADGAPRRHHLPAGPGGDECAEVARLGVGRTVETWLAIRLLYPLGVSPARLARLYPDVR